MSRCFPFPPPGYVLNEIRDEALMIDSIKGAEDKAKNEQSRKERKSEKKEKKDKKDKKEKKEKKDKKDKKRKDRESVEGESEKHSHKRRRKEEVAKDVQNHQTVDVFRKLKQESENDCLEKSSLTVERELLQSTSQNSCDSTLNSNELQKQKEKQPLDGSRHNNNDSESILRIRLPIRRPKNPEVMMTTEKDQLTPCPSREIKLDTSQRVTREQPEHPCSTSAPEHEEKRKDHIFTAKLGNEKKLSATTHETSQPSSLCRFCPPSMAVQFLNVVENWVPSTIETRVEELTNSEDAECWWLTKKPSSHKFDTERCNQLNRNNETKQVVSSSIAWPCARLLPEADVLVLPFTVPF